MQRFSATHRVIVWEEPVVEAGEARLAVTTDPSLDIRIVTPHLPAGLDAEATDAQLRTLLDGLIADEGPVAIRWYYTPMMLRFSRQVAAQCTVYDCMDELANFSFAPADLLSLESELLTASDVVFTGGYSLYEAKRDRHPNVLPFPSSVDVAHFARARDASSVRPDGTPRLGFYGVIDERMDLDLLAAVADARPDWTIEIVGPVVKIDPAALPQRPNIHYPGARTYDELPATLAGWDVALMPFAINEATRFISPTKTPEYLASGRPVVSTAIVDVARHYGTLEAVKIAAGTERFIECCDEALALTRNGKDWLAPADAMLAATSWSATAGGDARCDRRSGRDQARQGAPLARALRCSRCRRRICRVGNG